jgi:hypothetical protein
MIENHLPRHFSIVRFDDLVALLVQKAGKYLKRERVVVDKKDLHWPLLPIIRLAEFLGGLGGLATQRATLCCVGAFHPLVRSIQPDTQDLPRTEITV